MIAKKVVDFTSAALWVIFHVSVLLIVFHRVLYIVTYMLSVYTLIYYNLYNLFNKSLNYFFTVVQHLTNWG